jgi:hypothetical protein
MKPGRKTTQAIGEAGPDIPGIRPDPPKELSPDEQVEWHRFWAVSPPDWFPRETWPLLVQLCRHVCQSRFLGGCLQEVRTGLLDPRDPKQIQHLNTLSILHEREGRAMGAIMEKLRLTTQQRVHIAVASPQQQEAAPDVKPWVTQ